MFHLQFTLVFDVVFYVAAFAFCCSIIFGFVVLFLHLFQQKKSRYREEFRKKILPYFAEVLFNPELKLPVLSKKDRVLFLEIWNHFNESVKGSSAENLNQLLRQLGLEEFIFQLVRRKSERLLALWTFGNLREVKAWEIVLHYCSAENPILSLTATQALLRIDAVRGLPLVLDSIKQREDWPVDKVRLILKELNPFFLDSILVQTSFNTQAPLQLRMIYFLKALRLPSSGLIIRKIIEQATENQVIAEGLSYLHTPEDLSLIRSFLHHPDAGVRAQAALALGYVGSSEDIEGLTKLLSDPNWKVRYQAAKALAQLPFVGAKGLEEMKDRFSFKAQEIITHVVAEEAL